MSNMKAEERCALINRVAQWCFDNTESFDLDDIGTGLAYLLWAIAADDGEPFCFGVGVPDYYAAFKRLLRGAPEGLWDELKKEGFVIE